MNPMNILRCIVLAFACMTHHSLLITSASSDSITNSQSLKDGETLVSTGAKFELGFFSPGSSKNRYLGIWYKNIPVITVVWVANRENPVQDFSGMLRINSSGSVVLSSRTNSTVWSANSTKITQSPLLQILDSGNLVLRDTNEDGDSDEYLWQSFDHPSDTLLPGMKLGWDLRTSLNRRLTSWKSPDDTSPGELAYGVELDPYPQAVLYKGPRKYFLGGPWNGLRFSGAPQLKENPMYSFNFVSNKDEVYYIYHLKSESVITRFVVNQSTSTCYRCVWVEAQKSWKLFNSFPSDICDAYGTCGANSLCKISDSPMCQCLEGFKPRLSQSWGAMDWSGGCVRDKALNCTERHNFIKFSGLKLPDTSRSWMNESMSFRECREMCLKNCSCTAYANTDIRGRGSGCALWFDDLLDIRQFPEGGQDLYIRMSASNQGKGSLVIIAAVITPTALFGGLLIIYLIYRRKMKLKEGGTDETRQDCSLSTDDFDLPIYELAAIALATDHFSETNKLGEGGFGPVYKGSLNNNGQNVAVKRLSKSSRQGLEEFKSEVKLIAKLQHRNLVKLIGCCVEGDEKILIYEYMPNGSLSSFLFDQRRSLELSWAKRFSIACGVARGLLYLHEDSRLRIIHRDLKASNVLLDDHLNPKISDFGMARIFGGDQIEESTSRIVGTYGYMAPEYALYGLFSVKSDVFSFGVLILEIVSGKKNRGSSNNLQNLIEYAWKLWTEGKPLDMIEQELRYCMIPEITPEITRCIHVGLLCVQENPEDRPSMSTVVIMLNGEGTLPHPKQPGFLINFVSCHVHSSLSHKEMSLSRNDFSITTLDGR